MQQYVVPQFIDVEDKIIGPVTTRQFVIMLAGSLLIAIFYKVFDFSLFLTSGIVTLIITGIFAFLKINGRPFHFFVLNLFQTLKRPKLRVWYSASFKEEIDYDFKENSLVAPSAVLPEKRHSASRLAELSLIVDTKGAYRGENGASDIQTVQRK